ncbi:sodium:proton antiporter [Aureimonas endophytica]|uniref:Sodium:proton antiporter n=1 Tax=Aureimonas endophytica TaxID=2027858 RepID=A0A916ZJG6_9HYPH|nr:cation:proton antiporter [Aureimonas endophytica]GGE00927.1 sodium:proton antiporter [Aureimonas endophytica]
MTLPTAVILFVAIVALGALAQPAALRLRIPASVVLAFVGIVVGFASHYSLAHPGAILPLEFAEAITNLPIGSSLFLYVFLPTLIFQSALQIDIHRVREDLLPILILALVAVVVATFGVAFAIAPFANVPLFACLILAALVATTDPVAVIGIFKDVGAPERLTRLVEGESLFNDAAAISLFLVFTGALLEPGAFRLSEALLSFVVMPIGGAALGFVLSWALLFLLRFVPDDRLAAISLSLAVPFVAFWVAEHEFHVSGIIALVVAGITLASLAPGRMTPEIWRYLQDIWEQLAAWSAVLIFFMTALLVPKLVAGAQWSDFGLLAILFVAALAARAVILYGLFPLLSRLDLTPPLTAPFRLVTLWGGLRGSMTLALALAVTENPAMPPSIAAFVATLATGYTLLTLFVQGTTLRWLIQRLGLTELPGVDRAVRDIALDATSARVAALSREMAERFGAKSGEACAAPETSLDGMRADGGAEGLSAEERATLALISLTARERDLILSHFARRTVSPSIARWLVSDARRRLDAVRASGAAGYREITADETAFIWLDRVAVTLQRRFGINRPLGRRLAARFQKLMETVLILDDLLSFAETGVQPVLGAEAAEAARALVAERREQLDREIAAVRLQYPQYVRELERWIIDRSLHALELAEIADMRATGLINQEVERDALKGLNDRRGPALRSPDLDLSVDSRELLDQCSLFAPLGEADKTELARLLRPSFEVPGIPIITRGERGMDAYFISSGAVEIDTGTGRHRLGRGDFFGELALLFDVRRTATVRAIAYSTMLRLSKVDFDAFLATHPDLRKSIEAIGQSRLAENARTDPVAAE